MIINDWDIANNHIKQWKKTGDTIVFTNGCFDTVSYTHLTLPTKA